MCLFLFKSFKDKYLEDKTRNNPNLFELSLLKGLPLHTSDI